MSDLSTRPYLIRAIYEWCVDSGLTPYLAVRVDEHTEVPRSHVKDGEIVPNLSADAVRNLQIGQRDDYLHRTVRRCAIRSHGACYSGHWNICQGNRAGAGVVKGMVRNRPRPLRMAALINPSPNPPDPN